MTNSANRVINLIHVPGIKSYKIAEMLQICAYTTYCCIKHVIMIKYFLRQEGCAYKKAIKHDKYFCMTDATLMERC